MGGQTNQQPVYYDASTGQYYTNDKGSRFADLMSGGNTISMEDIVAGKLGRRYINPTNNAQNNSSPLDALIAANANMKTNAPSLADLFPALYGAGNTANTNSSLIGSQAPATGAASSGAGRFM